METKSMATSEHSNHLPPAATAGEQTSQHDEHSKPRGFWRSKTALAVVGFLLIGAFLLLSEHRAHALGFLPLLLILACLLLHIFMHGGHGGHGKGPERSKPSKGGTQP
jgi:cell division protein FtsW (lipid II flippase)